MLTLTTEDVLTLRASCKGLRNLGGGVDLGTPYILFLPADGVFCLHAYGSPQAKHASAALLGLMLQNERAEPGFIRRVLSAVEPPDLASLSPAAHRAETERRAAERRKREAYEAEQAATAARRASALDVSKLTLDDLL